MERPIGGASATEARMKKMKWTIAFRLSHPTENKTMTFNLRPVCMERDGDGNVLGFETERIPGTGYFLKIRKSNTGNNWNIYFADESTAADYM